MLIREGSAAKNFEALIPLIDEFPDMIMFCSDDKHPNDLLVGHINLLVKRAIDKGYNIWNILKAACINPVKHYGLNIGQLKENDAADLIIIDNLTDFNILKTFINGERVDWQTGPGCKARVRRKSASLRRERQSAHAR